MRERGLAPGERQVLAWRPHTDAANLERLAVWQIDDEAAAFTWFKAKRAITARRQLKEPAWAPPRTNLLREDVKRLLRRRLHTQRDNHRAHLRLRSTCALNDTSWSAQRRSVSASHFFRSAIAPSFSV